MVQSFKSSKLTCPNGLDLSRWTAFGGSKIDPPRAIHTVLVDFPIMLVFFRLTPSKIEDD
jgi:hypothetical protein